MSICTDNWKEVEAQSKAALTEPIVAYIEECRRGDQPESNLISVLHKVQDHFGYLSPESLDAVAQLLQVPSARVSGVASFYHYFRLRPCGRFIIRVCLGTACYVKGAEGIGQKFKEELGIDFGETTTDGLFSLEKSRCFGTCGLAPVVMIGEDVHPQVTPDQVPAILGKYFQTTNR
jgi:NADH:ubiquinone oxidoreductase subunit E